MPSYDMVNKLDMSEMKNAIIQAQKEITGRYDFKGSDSKIELNDTTIVISAPDDYKIKASLEILRLKMVKRNIGMKAIEPGEIEPTGGQRFKQVLAIKNGIDKEVAKKINKLIKASEFKVTSAYMDEKIRITGKKIDDLQGVYRFIRAHDDVSIDVQMENMKS